MRAEGRAQFESTQGLDLWVTELHRGPRGSGEIFTVPARKHSSS